MDKKTIYARCRCLVQQKITAAEAAIREAQNAANEETKSSAGDKYETGRAMMHLEQEKLAGQRVSAQQLLKIMHNIDPDRRTSRVELGSLVKTDQGWFYVAVGLGKVQVNNESCFVISPAAPLGQALWGRQAGEEVMLNAKPIQIIQLT
jgi:transcription elongation GreA/GreB family factor